MTQISDEVRLAYERAVEAKREELGIDPNGYTAHVGQVITVVEDSPEHSYEIARPDVFEPHLITGDHTKWDSFDTSIHPNAAIVKATVGGWYNEAAVLGRSCLVEGNFGTGKTHLAQGLAEAYPFIRSINNAGVALVNEVDYIERLKASWDGPVSATEKLPDLILPYVLIFDDLGAYATRNADWLQNIYYNIFERRCEQRRPTLFLTNMALEKDRGYGLLKDRIDVRSYDRLIGALRVNPKLAMNAGDRGPLWHAELYDQPSARSGNIYTSVVGSIRGALKRAIPQAEV